MVPQHRGRADADRLWSKGRWGLVVPEVLQGYLPDEEGWSDCAERLACIWVDVNLIRTDLALPERYNGAALSRGANNARLTLPDDCYYSGPDSNQVTCP